MFKRFFILKNTFSQVLAVIFCAVVFGAVMTPVANATIQQGIRGAYHLLEASDTAALQPIAVTPSPAIVSEPVVALNTKTTLVSEKIERRIKELIQIFRKMVLDMMVDEIVKWIQGGGKPKFIDNPENFLKNAGDQAGALVLQDIVGDDMMSRLCNPDWAIRIYATLSNTNLPLGPRAKCSLSEMGGNWQQEYADFMGDFNNGGWKSWIKLGRAENNIYGVYLSALDKHTEEKIEAQDTASKVMSLANGFLSDDRCKRRQCMNPNYGGPPDPVWIDPEEGDWKPDEIGSDCKCLKSNIIAPAYIFAQGMVKSVFKDIEWLVKNEEWESYLGVIANAAWNRLTTEGFMALTSTDIRYGESSPYNTLPGMGINQPNPNDYLDSIPPTTQYFVYDPWRIQLSAAPDSNDTDDNIDIKYTIDGSSPASSATARLVSSPTPPIEITAPTRLRWIGVDKQGNEEQAQTIKDLVGMPILATPLFDPYPGAEYLDQQSLLEPLMPHTVAIAIDYRNLVLVSDKPTTTIYYTTDGTNPDVDNPAHEYKGEAIVGAQNQSLTIKWFGVTHNDSTPPTDYYREPGHLLVTTPYFPNSDLVMIGRLSDLRALSSFPGLGGQNPVANFTITPQGPVCTTYSCTDEFIRLNPGLSSADTASGRKIVSYEWDIDGDAGGTWDWSTADINGDDVFDRDNTNETKCVNKQAGSQDHQLCSGLDNVHNGFVEMSMPNNTNMATGTIDVEFIFDGAKKIRLRVMDNLGFFGIKEITNNVWEQ